MSEWIPVSERLPKNPNRTILAASRDKIYMARYWGDMFHFVLELPHESTVIGHSGDIMHSTDCITHWMPLPAPPKDDDQ